MAGAYQRQGVGIGAAPLLECREPTTVLAIREKGALAESERPDVPLSTGITVLELPYRSEQISLAQKRASE